MSIIFLRVIWTDCARCVGSLGKIMLLSVIVFLHFFGLKNRQYGPTPYRFLHRITIRLQI
jgi:hypothetical protein